MAKAGLAGGNPRIGKADGNARVRAYSVLIDGQPMRAVKPGEAWEVPAGVVHDEFTGGTPARILAVFTVEKGKALTSRVD